MQEIQLHNVNDMLLLLLLLQNCNWLNSANDMQSSRKIVWQSCQSNSAGREQGESVGDTYICLLAAVSAAAVSVSRVA